jgi:hypothetical protein
MIDEDVRCSFCGKSSADVARVVAGAGVYICDECVRLCVILVGAEKDSAEPADAQPRIPAWESMSDEQILEHLPRIAAVGDQVSASLHSWVGVARQRGVTWTRIGGALGMTRQSAWERFSGEE